MNQSKVDGGGGGGGGGGCKVKWKRGKNKEVEVCVSHYLTKLVCLSFSSANHLFQDRMLPVRDFLFVC